MTPAFRQPRYQPQRDRTGTNASTSSKAGGSFKIEIGFNTPERDERSSHNAKRVIFVAHNRRLTKRVLKNIFSSSTTL